MSEVPGPMPEEARRREQPKRLDIMEEFPRLREKLGREMKIPEAGRLLRSLAMEQDAIAVPYEQAGDDAAEGFREAAEALRSAADGTAGAAEMERVLGIITDRIRTIEERGFREPKAGRQRSEEWRNLHRLRDFLRKKSET